MCSKKLKGMLSARPTGDHPAERADGYGPGGACSGAVAGAAGAYGGERL